MLLRGQLKSLAVAACLAACTGAVLTQIVTGVIGSRLPFWQWSMCLFAFACVSFWPIKQHVHAYTRERPMRAISKDLENNSLPDQRRSLFGNRGAHNKRWNFTAELQTPHKNKDLARFEKLMSMPRMTEPSSKALGLFDGLPPFRLYEEEGEPWCLPILRTEAALRLSHEYLEKTGAYYDEGYAPPSALDEAAERKALIAHDIEASDTWIEAYRFASRMLPQSQREEIFFLRANDKLFRPKVDVIGQELRESVVASNLKTVPVKQISSCSRILLIASTAS